MIPLLLTIDQTDAFLPVLIVRVIWITQARAER